MTLTGKAKVEFEKWYNDNNGYKFLSCERGALLGTIKNNGFYGLENNMQYSVYVDFFDSVGIRIYLREKGHIEYAVTFMLYDGDRMWLNKEFKTRHEARAQAIEKANELYNSNINP